MPEFLPDSQTHRLCYFPGAPDLHRHVVVPNFVADEVEQLRDFVRFLYPQRGQDEFKLCRPDLLEPRWSVFSRSHNSSYAFGRTPLEAVAAAKARHDSSTRHALILFSECPAPRFSPCTESPSPNAPIGASTTPPPAASGDSTNARTPSGPSPT